MALSMKEQRNKKAYERAAQKLKKETLRKREEVERKYKDVPHPTGLDTDPAEKELGEVTHWFGQEIKRLRKKYSIK